MLIPMSETTNDTDFFFHTKLGNLSEMGLHTYLLPSSMDASIIDIWDKSELSVLSLWSWSAVKPRSEALLPRDDTD